MSTENIVSLLAQLRRRLDTCLREQRKAEAENHRVLRHPGVLNSHILRELHTRLRNLKQIQSELEYKLLELERRSNYLSTPGDLIFSESSALYRVRVEEPKPQSQHSGFSESLNMLVRCVRTDSSPPHRNSSVLSANYRSERSRRIKQLVAKETHRAARRRKNLLHIERVVAHDTFYKEFVKDINAARRSIEIVSPYVKPNDGPRWVIAALVKAQQRGVDVRIHVNPYQKDQIQYDYIQEIKHLGLVVQEHEYIHQKIAIVDDQFVWEGSLNILLGSGIKDSMRRLHGKLFVQEHRQLWSFLRL